MEEELPQQDLPASSVPSPSRSMTRGWTNGIAFYTPTVNDVLLDAWISVLTAFDGTTPLGDVGHLHRRQHWRSVR